MNKNVPALLSENMGELQRASVVAVFATPAADGKIYQVEYFNLDTIISPDGNKS